MTCGFRFVTNSTVFETNLLKVMAVMLQLLDIGVGIRQPLLTETVSGGCQRLSAMAVGCPPLFRGSTHGLQICRGCAKQRTPLPVRPRRKIRFDILWSESPKQTVKSLGIEPKPKIIQKKASPWHPSGIFARA